MVQRTIKQAAEDWGVSPSLVRKWLAQGRIKSVRPGYEILVTSAEPPKRGQRLTTEQRAAWPKRPAGSDGDTDRGHREPRAARKARRGAK